jgi:hypothetical protein
MPMRVDDLGADPNLFELPIWLVADVPEPPCQVYVFPHERHGKTVLVYTDEDAALLTIERAPLVGKVPCKVDDLAVITDLFTGLKSEGVTYVGIDIPPDSRMYGRYAGIDWFIDALRRA